MLTTLTVTKAAPQGRPYKLSDSGGLFLLVTPSGGKLWRYKYRYGGKEKLLALGNAEIVKLSDARSARDDARKLLKGGTDPSADRKRAKAVAQYADATSFEAVAREWYENDRNLWSNRHADYILRRMENDLFPDLGAVPIAQLEAVQILACIRKIEGRGAYEMASRSLQYVGKVFRYAIGTGRAKRDWAADLTDALKKAPEGQHLAALKVKELPAFFKNLREYEGFQPATPLAIRLLMLTAVRTSELLGARWNEIDGTEWRIPAERMKMGIEHVVPLSKQALAVLDQLRPISGGCDLIFPSPRKDHLPMSNNTVLFALYRLGYHGRATGHGMRTLFSTTMNETLEFPADVIEAQLAHKAGGVRADYNRAEWIKERRRMMQAWGDFLSKKGLR